MEVGRKWNWDMVRVGAEEGDIFIVEGLCEYFICRGIRVINK